jgi:hypothetical protein
MKDYKVFILLLTLVTVPFMGTLSAGRYAGDFMSIGSGVRPLGMGGAYSAVANDGNAIYWNASGIAQIRESEITFMHAFLYKGIAAYDNITFCQPLPNNVTIGLNLTRLTVDEIPNFDEKYLIGHNVDERINNSLYHLPGVPEGYFKSTDDLYQFAFAKHLHYDVNLGWLFFAVPLDVNLGTNIKLIKRQIKESMGTGTGFDLSFMAKTDLAVLFDMDGLGKITYATNFQDIAGTEITWGENTNLHKDEILFNTKVGVAVEQPITRLKSIVTFAFDRDYVYNAVYHWGMDWEYAKIVNLRLGYYDKNYTAGASVKISVINLDYAMVTNTLGLTNRVGLRFSF